MLSKGKQCQALHDLDPWVRDQVMFVICAKQFWNIAVPIEAILTATSIELDSMDSTFVIIFYNPSLP